MACSKLMWALQTPWFNLIVAVIMMGLSIYQITGAYGTMKDLNDIADDFAMIIANWEGQPITEIDVLAAGSTCPSGWTKFPWYAPQGSWPGTSLGPCACPKSAYQNARYNTDGMLSCSAVATNFRCNCYDAGDDRVKWCWQKNQCTTVADQDSSSSTCSVNQTAMNCYADPALAPLDMTAWRNSTICYKTGGTGVLTSGKIRPMPTASGCPADYTQCGSGSLDKQICMSGGSSVTCPLTAVKQFATASAVTIGNSSMTWTGFKTLGDGTVLAYRRAGKNELPLVAPSSQSGVTAQNQYTYLADSASQLPCIGQIDTGITWNKGSSTTGANGQNNYGVAKCENSDDRYVLVDQMNEYEVLQQNLLSTNSSYCGSPTTTNFPFYQKSGLSGNEQLCATSDTTCNNIMKRTSCQKASMYTTPTTASHLVLLAQRPQIFWSESCYNQDNTDPGKVTTVADPVDDLKTSQTALFYILLLTCIVSTWIIPIMLICNSFGCDLPCVGGSEEAEQLKLKMCAACCDAVFFFGNNICVITAFVVSMQHKGWFASTAGKDCSDTRTSATFSALSDTLDGIYINNMNTLIINCFMLIYKIYGCCYLKATKMYRNFDEYENHVKSVEMKEPV